MSDDADLRLAADDLSASLDATIAPIFTMPISKGATVALIALSIVGVANALDRQIMAMVLPLIRSEFHLDDIWLGLLSGPAFATTYAICGVPLALLADRIGRRRVIAGALAFFSATTVLCGLAGSFWQLVIARLATGVGEAGTTSPCNALIADLYPERRRVGPLSLFAASGNIGLLLAYFGGGWIAEHWGWRAVFLATAAFGGFALVALYLAGLGSRGPSPQTPPPKQMPLRLVVATLWKCPGVPWIVAGAAIASVGGYAASAFTPSFLARSHHMSPTTIGITLAILVGTIGWIGTVLPGLVAQRWKPSDPGFALELACGALVLALPLKPVFYLAGDVHVAIAAAVPAVFVSAIFLGPSFAGIQHVAPPAQRAQAAAFLLLALNLVGLGLGPQLVGILSHLLQPSSGENALRYALAIVVTAPVIPSAWCFWLAARALRRAKATDR